MIARLLLASSFTVCLACGGSVQSPDPVHDDSIVVDEGGSSTATAPPAVDASVARIHIDHVYLCCAQCSPPYRPVDYDRQTRLMSWPACDEDAGVGGSTTDAGDVSVPAVSRVLSPSEAQQLEALLQTVTYTANPTCGGEDGEEYYLNTYDDLGHVVGKYSAENINCYGYPSAPRIVDVYNLLVTFRG